MFEELDRYIKDFENDDYAVDYWYDEGVSIAEDMLQDFDDGDWKFLLQELPEKTVGWKRRLAYCLNDSGNLKQLEVLLTLLDTDDTELLEISLDSLRSFKDNQVMMQNRNLIKQKIEALMPKAGVVTKKMLNDYGKW